MRFLPLLLGLVLCAPADALAGELREAVLAALDGVEDTPSREGLAALEGDVAAELLQIASDPTLPHSRRGRAISALGWFPTDGVHQALSNWLASDDRLFARKAAYALATGWGEAAIPELTTALSSDDVQLRAATARALGMVEGELARRTLQERLAVEPNAAVQDSIRAALGQ